MRLLRRSVLANPLQRLAAISMTLIALAGCGTQQAPERLALPPTPLPSYGLGDSFQFSDGSQAAVASVTRDEIRWRGSDGLYATTRDVLLPRLNWTNRSQRGERRMGKDFALLFPLEAGRSVAFTASRTVRPVGRGRRTTVHETWQCEVDHPARLTVPAGSFDTWPVRCTMREPSASSGVLQQAFYYAPDIGFYVRREELVGDGPVRVVELTGYTATDPVLADSTLRERSLALQRTLERDVSGSSATWNDPATSDRGEISVQRTMETSRYGWCREFGESIRSGGRLYRLHGTGCRSPSKVWEIVLLAPGA